MENIVVIHGGAGSPSSLNSVLKEILSNIIYNGTALDMAIKPVVAMENNSIFNAGTGSVPRIDGSIQMDAAVMIENGFGSVICIENVSNPVLVARDVMEKSPHIMISGDGATEFARKMGHEYYNPETEKSKNMMIKFKESLKNNTIPEKFQFMFKSSEDTVGAVSRINGKFAAAVSTGGSFPMLRGRVGDSPVIGAGIFAGNKGAVVATGIGEEIAKSLLSYRIYEAIGTEKLSDIVKKEVNKFKVSAGIIAISEEEQFAYSNTDMAYSMQQY
ncbi:isoaspartyl peptidase/L-asparaginase [Ferroplasma sp.]|uniref:isoaspartyl peptidase/L-asparaginase n=1 Tax=Ferroplasma sp. TaxID=2591003 RepID=UPI00307D6D36